MIADVRKNAAASNLTLLPHGGWDVVIIALYSSAV